MSGCLQLSPCPSPWPIKLEGWCLGDQEVSLQGEAGQGISSECGRSRGCSGLAAPPPLVSGAIAIAEV